MMGYGTVPSALRLARHSKSARLPFENQALCLSVCVIGKRLEKDERKDRFNFQLLNTTRLLI